MTATYCSFQTVTMQQQQQQQAQRRTPSPEQAMQGFNGGGDYSPTPGADASSQSSPGSASDHMGMFSSNGISGFAPPNFPGSAAIAAFDAGMNQHMNRVITTTSPSPSSNDKPSVVSRRKRDVSAPTNANGTTVRRQKRLQRNRESARLSRRRRKQYLEELEERVDKLSEELDEARRHHVADALTAVRKKRIELLSATTHSALVNLSVLENAASRTSEELMISTTFQVQQLMSFSASPSMQFILWLTLQTDAFFRGGRAASERLSAARIGERMLSSGTETAAPSQSMWPLLCNEVGLSYDQEEKLRTFQRTLLQDPNTWVDRHTAWASRKVMSSVHDTVQALTLRAGQRDRSSRPLLSEEQRLKMMSWSVRNRDRVAHSTRNLLPPSLPSARDISPQEQHVAANLYIINEQLQQVLQTVPRAAPLVIGAALKKLSHRPTFEPLGACDEKGDCPVSSYPSSGSLKRAASEMSMDDESNLKPQVPTIVPVEAQASALETIQAALRIVEDLLPSPPVLVGTTAVPSPIFVSSQVPTPIPVVSLVYQAPLAYTQSAPAFGALEQNTTKHSRQSSFMPAHLNVVSEEMWPADEADDFLLDMIEGDWAIGEGIDMDILE